MTYTYNLQVCSIIIDNRINIHIILYLFNNYILRIMTTDYKIIKSNIKCVGIGIFFDQLSPSE